MNVIESGTNLATVGNNVEGIVISIPNVTTMGDNVKNYSLRRNRKPTDRFSPCNKNPDNAETKMKVRNFLANIKSKKNKPISDSSQSVDESEEGSFYNQSHDESQSDSYDSNNSDENEKKQAENTDVMEINTGAKYGDESDALDDDGDDDDDDNHDNDNSNDDDDGNAKNQKTNDEEKKPAAKCPKKSK